MDALTVLTQRNSIALLGGQVSEEQEHWLLKAALRAADHGWLHPTRFMLIKGQAREALGELFLHSAQDWQQLSEEKQQKLLNAPLRAPLVIVVIHRAQEHPKIPPHEQLLSSAASAQNILNAAAALGLGAIWRTGEMADNVQLHQALGLEKSDKIVGFIYVGEPKTEPKPLLDLAPKDFVLPWQVS